MKKITIILLLMFGTFSISIAQTTSTTSTTISKQDKAALAAQKKADKQAKALAKKQAKEASAASANTAAADKKKADKEAKALAKKQAAEAKASTTTNATTAHLNKNGIPDKRFKANKQTTVNSQAQTQTPTALPQTKANPVQAKAPTKVPQTARTTAAKTTDQVISTDAKGRTIYQGPRGGKYYINKNGNKEYVK